MVGVALLYVAGLLVAPLVGITYYGLKSGLGTIGDTLRPDRRPARVLSDISDHA